MSDTEPAIALARQLVQRLNVSNDASIDIFACDLRPELVVAVTWLMHHVDYARTITSRVDFCELVRELVPHVEFDDMSVPAGCTLPDGVYLQTISGDDSCIDSHIALGSWPFAVGRYTTLPELWQPVVESAPRAGAGIWRVPESAIALARTRLSQDKLLRLRVFIQPIPMPAFVWPVAKPNVVTLDDLVGRETCPVTLTTHAVGASVHRCKACRWCYARGVRAQIVNGLCPMCRAPVCEFVRVKVV